jgi:hypothetical protein
LALERDDRSFTPEKGVDRKSLMEYVGCAGVDEYMDEPSPVMEPCEPGGSGEEGVGRRDSEEKEIVRKRDSEERDSEKGR